MALIKFTRENRQLIRKGIKTQTRRPVRQDVYCRYGHRGDALSVVNHREKFKGIYLAIENVRNEQLRSISDADARAEGYDIDEFPAAWNDLYSGAEIWEANPLVWVIEFKVIRCVKIL